MSAPSEFAAYATTSAKIFAPRACACSSDSRTTKPPPPAMTKPSRSAEYGRDAVSGVSLYLEHKAPIASNNKLCDQ